MSCGVVSIDLALDHQAVLSAVMLWFAAAVWLLLTVVLAAPLVYQRGRFQRDAAAPVTLAGVAATAVLGTRLAGQDYRVAAAALLALAGIGWAVLLVPVLRHWKTPAAGTSFIAGVATDGLAVLSATLAVPYRAGWLVIAAIVFLLTGLVLYVFTLVRFDWRQLLSGHGDHWIAGGALAISALSAGLITKAAGALGRFGPQHQVLSTGTLVLWCLALAWLPVLIAAEVVRRRPGYDIRRWATVFPLGMYAACSFTVGQVAGIAGITTFGKWWTWVAFAATLLALAGLFLRIRHTWPRSGHGSGPGDGPARHRLRELGSPGGRRERVGEVLGLVHHLLISELHDAHRVGGLAVVGDDALAHPQVRVAGDPLDGEMPAGRVPAALRRDRDPAPEPFPRLGIVEDRVLGVDGVLGFGVPAFGGLPVLLDRGPGPRVGGPRVRGLRVRLHGVAPSAGWFP